MSDKTRESEIPAVARLDALERVACAMFSILGYVQKDQVDPCAKAEAMVRELLDIMEADGVQDTDQARRTIKRLTRYAAECEVNP